jgi:transporter family protein
MWIVFAFGSAILAGLTAILSKIGIRNTDSNVATALRTIVVLVFSWLMVFVAGSHTMIPGISAYTLLFLVLSGLATGASWLCYFKALQLGDVNKVTPIDKSSTILTMILAFIFLGEEITLIKAVAIVLIGAGTYLMIQKSKAPVMSVNDGTVQESGLPGTASEPGRSEEASEPDWSKEASEPDWSKEASEPDWTNSISEPVTAADASEPSPDAALGHLASIPKRTGGLWLIYAVGAAVFASLTSILGKIGITGVESNLGTAIRTIVVLIMAWMIVFVTKKQHTIKEIDSKSMLFLVLSGFATGGSWLCYYRALQDGPASVVVPIDKMSIVVTIAFSSLFLKEKLTAKSLIGLILISAGTLSLLL